MLQWIGWVATALTASSYFFRKSATLRFLQAGGAVLWLTYGALIHALPVVVANVIVAAAAIFTWLTARKAAPPAPGD